MFETTPPESVSKNITWTSVWMRGTLEFTTAETTTKTTKHTKGTEVNSNYLRALRVLRVDRITSSQDRHHSRDHFLDTDRFHAAKINRAFAQETGTAFHLVTQHAMTLSERSGRARPGRAENRNHRNSEQSRHMHCTRIVGKEQTTLAQLRDQLLDGRLAGAIGA